MKIDITRAAWLDAARADAARLAAARATYVRPLRHRDPRPAWVPRALAAFGLALALFSSAWALVARLTAAPSTVVAPRAAIVVPAAPFVPGPTAPPPAAVVPVRRMKHVRARPVEPKLAPSVVDDEPLGDVIYGKPPVRLPPLFTTEEYKSRGLMKQ